MLFLGQWLISGQNTKLGVNSLPHNQDFQEKEKILYRDQH